MEINLFLAENTKYFDQFCQGKSEMVFYLRPFHSFFGKINLSGIFRREIKVAIDWRKRSSLVNHNQFGRNNKCCLFSILGNNIRYSYLLSAVIQASVQEHQLFIDSLKVC